MVDNQLFCIFLIYGIDTFIACVVEDEVVANSAADEAFLHAGENVHAPVDIEQGAVVGVQILAHLRMDARRTGAAVA